jgi:hypothetical protein
MKYALAVFMCLAICCQSSYAAQYCVQNVSVSTGKPAEGLGIISRPDQLLSPRYQRTLPRARFPIIYDSYSSEAAGGGWKSNHTAFWHFLSDYTLSGPIDNGYTLMSTITGDRSIASDADGNIYWIGSGRAATATGNQSSCGRPGYVDDDRIFKLASGSSASDAGELFLCYGVPRGVFFGSLLNKVIMSFQDVDGNGVSQKQSTYALQDDRLQLLDEYDTQVLADIPSLNATALLGRTALRLVSPNGQSTLMTHLNSGDDYNGWDRLKDLGDGWMCADGAQYSNAVHIKQVGEHTAVSEIIRIRPAGGALESLARWAFDWDAVQIQRDKLSRIIDGLSCSDFEKNLNIEPPLKDARDLGYSESIQTNVYRVGKQIYLHDRGNLIKAEGQVTGLSAILRDVPSLGRLFITSNEAEYEIFRDANTFKVERINLPSHEMPLFTHFIASPVGSGLFAITSDAIYLYRDGAFILFWSPPENTKINITGHITPVQASGWNSILFSTSALSNTSAPTSILRLSQCN